MNITYANWQLTLIDIIEDVQIMNTQVNEFEIL